jgi:UDPglucose 6-dehydrogenase
VFIAVGTPSRRGDGHADLSYVYAAAREIAAALKGFTVVVTKSTVPVGTGDEVERLIRETNPSADVDVASNPEFLREGAAIRDFKFPTASWSAPRDERARKVLRRYLPAAVAQPGAADVHGAAHRRADQIRRQRLPRHQDHLHQRDRRSVRKSRRRRAGSRARHRARQPHRLEIPACRPGFGGSCFPKDTRRWSRSRSTTTCRCASSRPCSAVNDNRKRAMARKVANACGGNLRGKTVAVLGLTFKPDTDDMREARPAIVDLRNVYNPADAAKRPASPIHRSAGPS